MKNRSDLLKLAIQQKEIGEYEKAREYLDQIIRDEPENHLAWYEKSLLPIMQGDSVTIKSRNVSLSVYQRLPLAEKICYLQQCGFSAAEIPEIEARLNAPNLVAEQRVKYLKIAIRYAPEAEKINYTSELDTITGAAAEKSRRDKKAVRSIGLTALLVSVAVISVFGIIYGAALFKTPATAATILAVIIALLIPYVLSVTGMTLYARARGRENGTALGLVSNFLALIISNLSIIGAVILFAVK